MSSTFLTAEWRSLAMLNYEVQPSLLAARVPRGTVRRGDRRGVVFVKEIVPRFAIAAVARIVYGENYVSLPMRHRLEGPFVEYGWRALRERGVLGGGVHNRALLGLRLSSERDRRVPSRAPALEGAAGGGGPVRRGSRIEDQRQEAKTPRS